MGQGGREQESSEAKPHGAGTRCDCSTLSPSAAGLDVNSGTAKMPPLGAPARRRAKEEEEEKEEDDDDDVERGAPGKGMKMNMEVGRRRGGGEHEEVGEDVTSRRRAVVPVCRTDACRKKREVGWRVEPSHDRPEGRLGKENGA